MEPDSKKWGLWRRCEWKQPGQDGFSSKSFNGSKVTQGNQMCSSEVWSCFLTSSVCLWSAFIFVHMSHFNLVSLLFFFSGNNFLPSYSIVKPRWLKCCCCCYPFRKTSKPKSSSGLLDWSLDSEQGFLLLPFFYRLFFFFLKRVWQKACLSHTDWGWSDARKISHLLSTKYFKMHIWILKKQLYLDF